MLKENILIYIDNNIPKKEIAKKLNTSTRYINQVIQEDTQEKKFNKLSETVKQLQAGRDQEAKKIKDLSRTIQKLRDEQRIERKIKRIGNRDYSSFEKYITTISEKLSYHKIPSLKKHENTIENDYEGIFQLSDLHFNELISDLEENAYDFLVASKRLKKYTQEAIKHFKTYDIKKVLIAMTGDILGSDRRVDEKLNMATNRAKATIIGTFLIENVIRELNEHFEIKIAMVCGNESRSFELGDSDMIFSDNYDFVLYNMLKMLFKDNLDMFVDGDVYKKILKIKNKHIMMLHGHNLKSNVETSIEKMIGQISSNNKITLDYIIFGHIHQCQISDFYARSSSLSGGNAYSSNKLQLVSRSSQNIHIVSEHSLHSIKIDLQDTDGIEGYELYPGFEIQNKKKIKNLTVIDLM